MPPDHDEIRARLARARLLLLFTPDLCLGRDPLSVLESVLPACDIVQVRPKLAGASSAPLAPCAARETFDWTLRVLDLVRAADSACLVLVDDRVDVARALWERGCAGVHVGQRDMPPRAARSVLGRGPLIGLSTHSLADVLEAADEPVDYLGFGPTFATATKGYPRGLGAEACWVAAATSQVPLFPIGGIDLLRANEIALVGRAAVGSAILGAQDPARAARELRALLEADAQDDAGA